MPTPDGATRQARVPILMYHHITIPPANANRIERDISVSPAAFAEQLRYLKETGYETIYLEDLVYHLTIGRELPPNPVIITFDDSYLDNYTVAFPLLQEYGFAATFFIITDYVDHGLSRYMSWEQIREMEAAGMEIGSHSRDHADLRRRSYDFLVWQLLGSRETLEANLRNPIRAFSYPSGAHDAFVIEVLQSAHYWCAVGIEQGALQSSDRLYNLKRIRVRGSDSLEKFVAKLTLDW